MPSTIDLAVRDNSVRQRHVIQELFDDRSSTSLFAASDRRIRAVVEMLKASYLNGGEILGRFRPSSQAAFRASSRPPPQTIGQALTEWCLSASFHCQRAGPLGPAE